MYTCKYQKICEEKVLKGMMIKKKGLHAVILLSGMKRESREYYTVHPLTKERTMYNIYKNERP